MFAGPPSISSSICLQYSGIEAHQDLVALSEGDIGCAAFLLH